MAQTTGFDHDTLSRIIQSTRGQIAEMENERSQVESASETLISAVQASSGITLRQRLNEWSTDYQTIKSKLDALNNSVEALLSSNVNTDDTAFSIAGRK